MWASFDHFTLRPMVNHVGRCDAKHCKANITGIHIVCTDPAFTNWQNVPCSLHSHFIDFPSVHFILLCSSSVPPCCHGDSVHVFHVRALIAVSNSLHSLSFVRYKFLYFSLVAKGLMARAQAGMLLIMECSGQTKWTASYVATVRYSSLQTTTTPYSHCLTEYSTQQQ